MGEGPRPHSPPSPDTVHFGTVSPSLPLLTSELGELPPPLGSVGAARPTGSPARTPAQSMSAE